MQQCQAILLTDFKASVYIESLCQFQCATKNVCKNAVASKFAFLAKD